MTRDIIRLAREACDKDKVDPYQNDFWAITQEELERFAALVAAAEQKPISDVTEAVTKTVIDVEKLLCEKIGRQWQPSGMSIQTLVDELAALVAAAEREACAELCEEMEDRENPYERNVAVLDCAAAIRARGEA